MGKTKVWISDELYERVKQYVEKYAKDRSISSVIEEAVNVFLFGQEGIEHKDLKGVTAKIIQLQYPAKCRLCGRPINVGELAYWIKYTFNDNTTKSRVICLDCYYSRYDTAIAKKYLKKKELEAVVKGLKKEADQLAEEVRELEQRKFYLEKEIDLLSIKEELYNLHKEFVEYFKDFISNPDSDFSKLNEWFEKFMDLVDKVAEIEAWIRSKPEFIHEFHRMKKKKKQGQQIWTSKHG